MPRTCFAPGCKTGYKPSRNVPKTDEHLSLFRPPKDPELFALWKRAIPRVDRELGPSNFICEKHFRKEDIKTFSEVKLNDTTTWKYEKFKPSIREGAYPRIFTNVPGHSTYVGESKLNNKRSLSNKKNQEISNRRKKYKEHSFEQFIAQVVVSEADHSSNENKFLDFPVEKSNTLGSKDKRVKNKKCPSKPFQKSLQTSSTTMPFALNSDLQNKNSDEQLETVDLNNSFSIVEKNTSGLEFSFESQNEEQFSFSFLKNNVEKIEKINLWWTSVVFEDFIICARWNSEFALERKIVILKELKVKVFLKETETSLESDIQLKSIEDLSELMHRIEKIKICDGINNKEADCLGFLQNKNPRNNFCVNCLKFKKKKKLLQPLEVSKGQVELIRFNII